MTRSFSHYTDGGRVYLIIILKIFSEDQKIAAFGSSYRSMHFPVGAAEGCDLLTLLHRKIIKCPITLCCSNPITPCNELSTACGSLLGKLPLTRRAASSSLSTRIRPG